MTPKTKPSRMQIKLSKEQSQMMAIIIIATVVTVFCLVSAKALMSQALYQSKVISARNKSADQLKTNIANANTMVDQYKNVFIGTGSENIIGGKNDPNPYAPPPDGDNGRIVLDALPTVYDFPALLTSMSKLLSNDGIGGQSIGGTDQSVSATNISASNPTPVPIDITVSGSGTYANANKLITDLERSIRPFDVTHITLGGNESTLNVALNVTTYYQNGKTLSITTKEVK
jgi:hypothetical protein